MNGKERKKEFGDYQTPLFFAETVCRLLRDSLKIHPEIIIEPTAGIGNFISVAMDVFPAVKQIYGIEINEEYCSLCKNRMPDKRVQIINDNFFTCNIEQFPDSEEILLIGNPPWATNSELNINLPEKRNFKQFKGMDAITGSSNFDICEYIILRLIDKFKEKNVSLAMLCKTSVARNVLLELDRNNVSIDCVRMYNFNAAQVFDINAAACLLYVKMSPEGKHTDLCEILDIYSPDEVKEKILFKNGRLQTVVSDVADFEGKCTIEWRQGIKHDCAGVMELTQKKDDVFFNKEKEEIFLEHTLVYPLIKSSFFKQPVIKSGFSKYVIVTQKKPREETEYIKQIAPFTWNYLCEKKQMFDRRKSSIYKGAPAFSMFGVGDYSYARYKVGVSGFYKKPLFTLLYNEEEISHPVMLDDTSYFLAFNDYQDAYICMVLLNSEKVQRFLYSISFRDAKRPYTKKVLQRLDLRKCVNQITFEELKKTEKELGLTQYVSKDLYSRFAQHITGGYV